MVPSERVAPERERPGPLAGAGTFSPPQGVGTRGCRMADRPVDPLTLSTVNDDLAAATAALRKALDAGEAYRLMLQASQDLLHEALAEVDRARASQSRTLDELRQVKGLGA